jgi:hypothetical protein
MHLIQLRQYLNYEIVNDKVVTAYLINLEKYVEYNVRRWMEAVGNRCKEYLKALVFTSYIANLIMSILLWKIISVEDSS